MKTVLQTVKDDITTFLVASEKNNNIVFYNEKELQINLGQYLIASQHYDHVYLEYTIPFDYIDKNISKGYKNNYPWKSDIAVDIVVCKKKKYVPIELKYKTKKAKGTLERFGIGMGKKEIFTNQSAQNEGRYDFWHDVKRIELLKCLFKDSINGGFCLFMTNDDNYVNCPLNNRTVIYAEFSMKDGKHGTSKCWKNGNKQDYPNFHLDREYTTKWKDTQLMGINFHCNLLEV